MSVFRTKNFVTTALTACILGLAICPYFYIAIGALREFEPTHLLVILPLLLVASVFLLWRYVSKPIDHPKSTHRVMGILLVVMEIMSWLVVLAFLFIISFFNLLRGLEQIGGFCLFFLMAVVLCLPVTLISKTVLEQRLMRLPLGLSLSILVAILALAGGITIVDILTPSRPLY